MPSHHRFPPWPLDPWPPQLHRKFHHVDGRDRHARSGADGIDRTLNEDRIRLAVTGLSRAGKTVFITSLIHNLLALGQGCDTLPRITARLSQDGTSRLRSVEVLPAGAGVLPFFDYAAKLQGLAATEPAWPPRTEDLAQISLSLVIDCTSMLGRRMGPRRVRLDILDYPGEWLLDLPMLSQSYAEWSAQTLDLLRTSPRKECSEEFLAFVGDLRPNDRAVETQLHRGHLLYREALNACRTKHGLRYLQPGRFICPGPYSDAPFLWFFPMAVPDGDPKPGSAAALLAERFAAYQQHMRTSFFDTHFASFDRQIMLVDVLGALSAGKAAFEDTARVIKDLARSLNYGDNSMSHAIAAGLAKGVGQVLPSMFGRAIDSAAQKLANRQIEKITFVATKADHVPAMKRDNLQHMLRAVAGAGELEAGTRVSYHVAASVLSTVDGVAKFQERPVEVVKGIKLGEDQVRPYFNGDVPAGLPHDGFWLDRFFELPVFKPPPIDPAGSTGIPHRNLDEVLDAVIGDLL